MKKFAVIVVTCIVTFSIVELAQAQLLRRGCFSRSCCGNNSSCCQSACPTTCCHSECHPDHSNVCPDCPSVNYGSCCPDRRSRGCGFCFRAIRRKPASCPCPPRAPMMEYRVLSQYSACCFDCTDACGAGYTAACQAYCWCKYGNPPGTNCESLRPSCY